MNGARDGRTRPEPRAGVPDRQRAANRATVLGVLADGDPRPVSVLRTETGLSRPTLEAIIADLVAERWLEVATPVTSGGSGRPARRYRVVGDRVLVAGVDVGVGKVLVTVVDVTGAERSRARIELAPGADGDARVAALHEAVDRAVAGIGRTRSELTGLCVGVPGIVDRAGAIMRSVVVPAWTGPGFATELAAWAGCPTTVVNDTNLAVLAEHRLGAARGFADVVYVHVGRRTRAGIMIDGDVHAGRHGSAGEVGSLPALYFDTAELLWGPTVGAQASAGDVRPVFDAAAVGDTDARSRVDAFCARLADVVSTLALVLDPQLVVLGGGVSRAGQAVLDGVTAHLAVDALPAGGAPLVLSDLGDAGVALGAAQHGLLTAADTDPALAAIVSRSPRPPTCSSSPPSELQPPRQTRHRSQEILA